MCYRTLRIPNLLPLPRQITPPYSPLVTGRVNDANCIPYDVQRVRSRRRHCEYALQDIGTIIIRAIEKKPTIKTENEDESERRRNVSPQNLWPTSIDRRRHGVTKTALRVVYKLLRNFYRRPGPRGDWKKIFVTKMRDRHRNHPSLSSARRTELVGTVLYAVVCCSLQIRVRRIYYYYHFIIYISVVYHYLPSSTKNTYFVKSWDTRCCGISDDTYSRRCYNAYT